MADETIPEDIKQELIKAAREQNLKGVPGTPANLAATALSEKQLSNIPGTPAYRKAQEAVNQANATPIEPKKDS